VEGVSTLGISWGPNADCSRSSAWTGVSDGCGDRGHRRLVTINRHVQDSGVTPASRQTPWCGQPSLQACTLAPGRPTWAPLTRHHRALTITRAPLSSQSTRALPATDGKRATPYVDTCPTPALTLVARGTGARDPRTGCSCQRRCRPGQRSGETGGPHFRSCKNQPLPLLVSPARLRPWEHRAGSSLPVDGAHVAPVTPGWRRTPHACAPHSTSRSPVFSG
jgi:hypothetical protein